MTRAFVYTARPSTVVFGPGRSAEAGDWIETLGCSSALVLSTSQQAGDAAALAEKRGPLAAGVFPGAAMHTPVEVTEKALAVVAETRADCFVALGGGSTFPLCAGLMGIVLHDIVLHRESRYGWLCLYSSKCAAS